MTLLAPPERAAACARRSRTAGQFRIARRSRIARLGGAAAAVLSAGLLAAACSGPPVPPHADSQPGASRLPVSSAPSRRAPTVVPSTTPAAIRSSPASSRSPVPQPAPTSQPGPAPSPTAVAPAPLAQCASAGLRVTVGSARGAAGSIYYPLDFTNISSVSCDMFGYPGVSFVSAPGGGVLGSQAIRNSAFGPSAVTLAPGAVAHASVQVVVAQNYPATICDPVTAHFLRVYPPGQYTPLYAGLTTTTCRGSVPGGSTLGIYVVRPGANGP
jgi:hypothetical protein